MEDTLRVNNFVIEARVAFVLILVLMEDTLRVDIHIVALFGIALVLILVLMEDTLRVRDDENASFAVSLNPCFNGRYSQS